jgi:hypothetical protein
VNPLPKESRESQWLVYINNPLSCQMLLNRPVMTQIESWYSSQKQCTSKGNMKLGIEAFYACSSDVDPKTPTHPSFVNVPLSSQELV